MKPKCKKRVHYSNLSPAVPTRKRWRLGLNLFPAWRRHCAQFRSHRIMIKKVHLLRSAGWFTISGDDSVVESAWKHLAMGTVVKCKGKKCSWSSRFLEMKSLIRFLWKRKYEKTHSTHTDWMDRTLWPGGNLLPLSQTLGPCAAGHMCYVTHVTAVVTSPLRCRDTWALPESASEGVLPRC